MVVASGGGLLGYFLKNKRVAFTRPIPEDPNEPIGGTLGAYSQYITAEAQLVVPISNPNIDFIHASSFFVNPVCAIGLLDRLRELGARWVIHTGAAS